MADTDKLLSNIETKEELKAVLPLDMKSGVDVFQQITTEFRQQNDFEAFLNKKVHFDNRDWTYGQFLYKYCFDKVQDFTYKCNAYVHGKPLENFGEPERKLAQKIAFLYSNNLAGPNAVLQEEKLKELDMFSGDKEKESFYRNLFANTKHSVDKNPCYWHPISQYQTLVIENQLSQMGMNSEQVRSLMIHCQQEREKAEKFYQDNMPSQFVHNSKVVPEEMGGAIQTRLRSVDTFITTQKYCFIAEPDSFHSGLPMQGDKEFKSWPRFSPKVMAFQMTADEFADKTQDSYNYQIDMSQKDSIRPCIPLYGGAPSEWVSVKDLSYLPDVQKETLADLQEQGKKFYLIANKNDWKLLEGAENLSENEAEAFMEQLCREGKATLFPSKDEIEEYKKQITQAREETNKKQAELRVKYDFKAPEFVAHATHVSQEEFKSSAGEVFAKYPENTDLVPAFSKGTQNEFNAERSIKNRFDDNKLMALGQLTPSPERVFAIATKQDDKGNPVLDEQGRPVPQDGSYAYSLKKCCASINMVDGETPLLIGFEGKYADFESGKKTGHIYIGKGENFKAEYDERGNITEYTSDKEMVVTHEYKTTPKDAMEHNVQLVMFKTEDGYDKWAAEVKNKRDKFATFIASDDIMIKLLQEEITAGRATYINATERGFNPKIASLQTSQENINRTNKSQELKIPNEITVVAPSAEHYQAFLTACNKMQDYIKNPSNPDDVSKNVSKGFIFAKEEFLSLSESDFQTKIVDEYAKRSQEGAIKPEYFRFVMVGDEIAGYVNVRALPRDEFDEKQCLETCKKWDYISKTGARACISDVLLPEYRGKGIIGKAEKIFFDELRQNGINEVSATVLVDNNASNRAHNKMVDNYGGKTYQVYGDSDGKGVQYYNRFIINTDTSGLQKDNYKEKTDNRKAELKIPFTVEELAERKQASNRRKQKFAAMKAHILNPESKTRENEKEIINPFIKNYIEQLRSK